MFCECEDCESRLAAMLPVLHDHVGGEEGDDV